MVKCTSIVVFAAVVGAALLYLIFAEKTDTNTAQPNAVPSGSSAEESSSPASLTERLASSDQAVRRKALVELSRLQRRELIASRKLLFELYLAIILADEDPDFVGQGCEILSRSPKSERIIAHAKHLIQEDQQQTRVAGALWYLKKHDPTAFAWYFEGKKYADLSQEVQRQLSGTGPIDILYMQHLSKIVDGYVNWQPPPHSADMPNPYREGVLAGDPFDAVVPLLVKSQANGPVSPAVARILGEMGAPPSIDYLLDEYKKDPRVDIGIAIGSSWRSLSIEKVFSSLDEGTLRRLLSIILEKRWERIKHQPLPEVKKYILENLVEIIVECRKRSRPVLE